MGAEGQLLFNVTSFKEKFMRTFVMKMKNIQEEEDFDHFYAKAQAFAEEHEL